MPFPAELTAEGRIRVGQAVVVPNIMAYATHSAVGIYDPGRHFLDLDEMTPALVGDALTAMVRHAQAVRRFDPAAQWSSINANYLPPAGASLIHPHLRSAHDAHGLTGRACSSNDLVPGRNATGRAGRRWSSRGGRRSPVDRADRLGSPGLPPSRRTVRGCGHGRGAPT